MQDSNLFFLKLQYIKYYANNAPDERFIALFSYFPSVFQTQYFFLTFLHKSDEKCKNIFQN